ncbi:P-loop containing nucleoside triphosphate hydrolase protein [Glonium stellatum]|uniref:P-loop containing nucleoside triphosphate hydrolase protein n=1 Tax=Glonium stellatum TaxID=574774 RepID=A0A8E2JPD7_9PEZI|nr:P-loop containing nucleoside triphosphate hydrolase protein [Glonium stellatum]
MAEKDTEIPPSILSWYENLNSRRVDIVGDYAGNELFLIEGDSVLLNCFCDAKIDFDDGFQLLHAVYAVEDFLRNLVQRKCNFHIVFFDQHRELCIPPGCSELNREKYLLARAVIFRHLQVNLNAEQPSIQLHVFPSFGCEAFKEYLESVGIYFIMCHDGALSVVSNQKSKSAKLEMPEKAKDVQQDEYYHSKIMFRSMIYWFVTRGYNAALVNGLEWQDTKVLTTILEGWYRQIPKEFTMPLFEPGETKREDCSLDMEALEELTSQYESDFTEREYLTILTISKMVSARESSSGLAATFLVHSVLLAQLPLSNRLVKSTTVAETSRAFMARFCYIARSMLESNYWGSKIERPSSSPHCDLADLVDGRLFNASCEVGSFGGNERLDKFLDAVKSVCGIRLPIQPEKKSYPNGGVKSVEEGTPSFHANGAPVHGSSNSDSKPYAVLPFTNPVFDAHLAPVKLATDRSTGANYNSTSAKIFREMSHWHNSKRPLDPKITPDQLARNKKAAFFAARRNQWFMAEMTAYAASLTNAVGKILDPEIITTGVKTKPKLPLNESLNEKANQSTHKSGPKVNPKAPKKVHAKSGKQAIMDDIAATKNRRDEVTTEKLVQSWRTTCKIFESEAVPSARYQKAKQYLSTLNTETKRTVLAAEVELFMLNVLLGMWISFCRDSKKQEGLDIAALIWNTVTRISKMNAGMTKTIAVNVELTIKNLGLPQLAIAKPENDRRLAFEMVLSTANLDLSVPLSPQKFQLLHCGPYFDRSIDSAPDDRVPFEPDGWQRKVLDEIDSKRSLLVIAPTSAGKTFISFYAMKQILESNDDDVLVYVAPTKALVNQIAAEVQARFSKSFKYPGKSVWGIHTRDYRINNPTGCQILVTVPHILQIMLLAPSNAKSTGSWSTRVKRIIFDEVHCIGQAEDGIIWEQLLLLAPCPIIALSATIGNPQEFNQWLSSTQKAIGNDLTMVSHPYRYSDLRKFVYTPPKNFHFQGLSDRPVFGHLGLDGSSSFTFVHPVTSLVNRSRGMPDDFSLEARDCLTLWESMSKHQNEKYKIDESLNPSQVLPKIIRKADIIKWEEGLKKVLREWLADSNSPFDAIIDDLSKPSHKSTPQPPGDNEDSVPVDPLNLCSTTLPLLTKLHQQDALPAILFNYDRSQCERICKTILKQLKTAEDQWKSSNPKWKTKLANWEAWKKSMAKIGKKGPPKTSKKKGAAADEEGVSKADLMKDAANTEISPWASFDPENPVDGFHFADSKRIQPSELAIYIRQLYRRDLPEWQSESLKRGVAVHHAGMNRKYRQVVEMLFRKGFLRVIIATGTLALGINMPCKTVVFSGDSVFLTALNFRQAAGRAGRRGFDMLGNVVFQGITPNKICRLISSRLPDLNGHFPITTTLVLRLFTLLHESKESPFAVRSINSLLSQPRLYLGGEESKMTVLHHLRFSIEYLRRQYLLDSAGAPLNFAGCVSHLYFTENSSFAFHALLKDGFFHNLCVDIDNNPEQVLRTLMLTMAHLFGRQYCRQADQEFIEEVVKRSPSVVFLPPLPKQAASILRNHNDVTLNIFSAYVRTFVEQHIKEPDCHLPLTLIRAGGDTAAETIKVPHLPPTSIRSSFVALSGHRDKFDSIHDLCTTTRSGVFLEEAVIPFVGLYPDEVDTPLNAYLYDFFMHGDDNALVTANGIRRGDVWFVLNDFSLILATIVTSLSNFMKLSPDNDMGMAEIMGSGDAAEEKKEDKEIPDDPVADIAALETKGATGDSLGSGAGSAGKAELAIGRKKKAKVADSWDDEADDDEDDEVDGGAEASWDDSDDDNEKPAWEEHEGGLLNVLRAFKKLREEFDTKFKVMWA